MKKSALIFLVLAYAASVFGVGVKEFYCCGKYVSSSLQYAASDSKHSCGMDESDARGCCNTKVQFHKVADSHGAAGSIEAGEKYWSFVAITNPGGAEASPNMQLLADHINSPHAPPIISAVPVYTLNCNFRL